MEDKAAVTRKQSDTNGACPRGQLAVFDFDGTSISGNSPVMLVKYLAKKGMLGPTFLFRIAMWGIAYAWHLPQNEEWARGLVFSAFEGMPKEKADAFLSEFYDKEVEPLYRARADEMMRYHADLGHTVVIVSASFEPIILRAMEKHAFSRQVSVQMEVDANGCYTRRVVGKAVEGEEKVRRVETLGDSLFGAGNWDVAYAYADHYSDIPLLEKAQHPVAVCPGPALAKHAKKQNWEIVEW